jgi:hypothetical protein
MRRKLDSQAKTSGKAGVFGKIGGGRKDSADVVNFARVGGGAAWIGVNLSQAQLQRPGLCWSAVKADLLHD